MRVQLSTGGLRAAEDLRSYVERRAAFALGRFADRLSRVAVRIIDENGPKGGPDLACGVELSLAGGGRLRVQDGPAPLRESVDRALDKAARSLARRLERERDGRQPRGGEERR